MNSNDLVESVVNGKSASEALDEADSIIESSRRDPVSNFTPIGPGRTKAQKQRDRGMAAVSSYLKSPKSNKATSVIDAIKKKTGSFPEKTTIDGKKLISLDVSYGPVTKSGSGTSQAKDQVYIAVDGSAIYAAKGTAKVIQSVLKKYGFKKTGSGFGRDKYTK